MYTRIDARKFIDKYELLFKKNKTYEVGYSLTLAQTKNKHLFFCRSIVLYNYEDNLVYDFITEEALPFIDLKKDEKLINYEPVYECIREQELNNLRYYLNDINPLYIDEDDILEDLHNLPMSKTFPIDRQYAISINGIPYIKRIPYIFKSQYLPSLKYSNGKMIIKDKDLYDLDEHLYIKKPIKKNKEKKLTLINKIKKLTSK